ncbi:peptidase inhibitor family I36 protein [Streptomyces sp. STR69]|uniref:peptidase inhibitor family I36 protein n=1 Tax=Streptomyces sp. STR69 TaxID=1796942 RepID=UPI0021C5AA63|nr:peptidase inhibitor family I36 protein [Streptomyces sp. STR69]
MTYKRLLQRAAAPAAVLAAIAGSSLVAAPPASAANTDCPDFYICIFENSNYTGRWIGVHQGYDNPNVGDFMNDRTTSIINNTNEDYRLFVDSNYRGAVLRSGPRTQYSNVGPAWNDKITSFRRTIWSDLD